eukprot:gene34797-42918_t
MFVKSLLPSLTTTLASETVDESLSERRRYIHLAMKAIMVQVPTGHSVLFPILSTTFPHKRFSRNVQTDYVSQLLVICEYYPMIQPKILELIVHKCMEMDVEIVIEDSGDVRIHDEYEGEDDDDNDFFNGGMSSTAGGQFAFDEDQPKSGGLNNTRLSTHIKKPMTEHAVPKIPQEVAEMADKLDSMLVLLVAFFDAEAARGATNKERLFQQLGAIFEVKILSAHKSKFVQFSLFYVASKNPDFAVSFAYKLLHLALDPKVASINRQ